MKTLEEAKQYLRDNYEEGTKCPCCGQNVKLYKRKLGSVMARCLIKMYNSTSKWMHVRDIVKGISDTGTNDFSKLKYWGMIEEQENTDTRKRNSGYWKLTHKGELFVVGRETVPSHAHIYNTRLMGWSDTQISIRQALGNQFDYEELMCS